MVKLRVEVHLPQFKGKNRSCVKYTWCTEVIVSTQLESSRFEFSAREQGSTRRFHSMEENASSSSSSSAAMQETANAEAILGAQGSEQIQETAHDPLLYDLFGAEPVQEAANAKVLVSKEELEELRALAQAPKRGPGRPWPKKETANAEKRKVGRPAEGEPAPKRAKPGRPVAWQLHWRSVCRSRKP